MKVAIIGYGKMGKIIEETLLQKGHSVGLKISTSNLNEFTVENLQSHDVAIEFSTPSTGYDNVITCLNAGIPVVSGTTGWNDRIPEAEKFCLQNKGALLVASNFSIGVNLFFKFNAMVAEIMGNYPLYKTRLEETHHVHKVDKPSGTAVTLAEIVVEQLPHLRDWKLDSTDNSLLPVVAHRIDEVNGDHSVIYENEIDAITLTHSAKNRKGFAQGAVLAAEYIAKKQGIFTMKDVLGIA